MAEVHRAVAPAERDAIDAALQGVCDRYITSIAGPIADAIRYSLMGEGKRLRARLLLEAYRAAGGGDDPMELAAAVEVVHAYSLVHDDLPCMDDDEMRRGRPTVHRAFGVATATAAGLAMVPLAARCAFNGGRALGLSPSEAGALVAVLMRAAGGGGMIGGQLLDLEGEGTALDLEQLERIHHAKTGELIRAPTWSGSSAMTSRHWNGIGRPSSPFTRWDSWPPWRTNWSVLAFWPWGTIKMNAPSYSSRRQMPCGRGSARQ